MSDAPPLPAVQTFGLTRLYGPMTALSNLDLTVNQGDLFGFIGSNGAGKTTTLRILATFLAPSAGRAVILGHDVVIPDTPIGGAQSIAVRNDGILEGASDPRKDGCALGY